MPDIVSRKKFLAAYKQLGETPLQTLNRIRDEFPDFAHEKMTYAGRLDPMAEGVLLVLAGEECRNKEKYLSLNKEYEAEFLLGFGTDTGDILGLAERGMDLIAMPPDAAAAAKSLEGKRRQAYPKYSSPLLSGKKEFFKTVEVYEAGVLGERECSSGKLLQDIENRILLVRGNFRQEEILCRWRGHLSEQKAYFIVSCRIACSSGTYVRVLAEEFGKSLGSSACVFSLKRTRVGEYRI